MQISQVMMSYTQPNFDQDIQFDSLQEDSIKYPLQYELNSFVILCSRPPQY